MPNSGPQASVCYASMLCVILNTDLLQQLQVMNITFSVTLVQWLHIRIFATNLQIKKFSHARIMSGSICKV